VVLSVAPVANELDVERSGIVPVMGNKAGSFRASTTGTPVGTLQKPIEEGLAHRLLGGACRSVGGLPFAAASMAGFLGSGVPGAHERRALVSGHQVDPLPECEPLAGLADRAKAPLLRHPPRILSGLRNPASPAVLGDALPGAAGITASSAAPRTPAPQISGDHVSLDPAGTPAT